MPLAPAHGWSVDVGFLTGTRRTISSVCPFNFESRTSTTAATAGALVTATLDKDLLVDAIGWLIRSDLNPSRTRSARSRIARAMSCAHPACFPATLAAPQPDPRARSTCHPTVSTASEKSVPTRVGCRSWVSRSDLAIVRLA